MKVEVHADAVWYHGSNRVFNVLEIGSTITPWKELAEAFSHKPPMLSYDDDDVIIHNGSERGYLYIIDEPITVDVDIYQHPRTTMDKNLEYLTKRPIKVRKVKEIAALSEEELLNMESELIKLIDRIPYQFVTEDEELQEN